MVMEEVSMWRDIMGMMREKKQNDRIRQVVKGKK
jgi:hypothetical protein